MLQETAQMEEKENFLIMHNVIYNKALFSYSFDRMFPLLFFHVEDSFKFVSIAKCCFHQDSRQQESNSIVYERLQTIILFLLQFLFECYTFSTQN